MDCADPARIRIRCPGFIDFVFERARDYPISGCIGPRHFRRRHRSGPQLRDDAFPNLGIRARMSDIQRVERQPGGVKFLVVASNAVGIDEGLGVRTRGSLRRGCRLAGA